MLCYFDYFDHASGTQLQHLWRLPSLAAFFSIFLASDLCLLWDVFWHEGGKMLPIKPGNLAIIHQQFPGVEMRKLEYIHNFDEWLVNQHTWQHSILEYKCLGSKLTVKTVKVKTSLVKYFLKPSPHILTGVSSSSHIWVKTSLRSSRMAFMYVNYQILQLW